MVPGGLWGAVGVWGAAALRVWDALGLWIDSESRYESGSVPASANPFPFSKSLYASSGATFQLEGTYRRRKKREKMPFINNSFPLPRRPGRSPARGTERGSLLLRRRRVSGDARLGSQKAVGPRCPPPGRCSRGCRCVPRAAAARRRVAAF